MLSVLTALAKAAGQLADPAVLRVLAKTLVVTALVFVALGWGLYFALVWLFDWLGWSPSGAGGGLAEATAAALIAIASAWLLLRVVALAVLQLFADEIVAAVETRHYPAAAARAKPLPLRRDIANSLRGARRALGFNALALPVAGVLAFTAIGPAIVFLLVNAVLLGRELTDMAWLRHCDSEVGAGIEGNPVPAVSRLLLGGAVVALMLVPFVNLIAPVIGAAAGTHLAHRAMASVGKETRDDA